MAGHLHEERLVVERGDVMHPPVRRRQPQTGVHGSAFPQNLAAQHVHAKEGVSTLNESQVQPREDTVLKLAESAGLEVLEQNIPRELLYIADEVFLTGTAAEITPVRSVDKIQVGEGKRGPITERLQNLFFGLFNGSTADRWGWLEPIVEPKTGRIERPVAV
jgi:hypothetical protein